MNRGINARVVRTIFWTWALVFGLVGQARTDETPWIVAIVTHVSDGDTVWIDVGRVSGEGPTGRLKVRIEGIDAPESCQAWGTQAGEALRERVLGRAVQVQLRRQDVYARWLGRLYQDGEDIGAWMVAHGHAWSYRYRQGVGPYETQERQARAATRGLFSQPEPMPPAVFRQLHGPCR